MRVVAGTAFAVVAVAAAYVATLMCWDYSDLERQRQAFANDIKPLLTCDNMLPVELGFNSIDMVFGRGWDAYDATMAGLPSFLLLHGLEDLTPTLYFEGDVLVEVLVERAPFLLRDGLHDSVPNADLLAPCIGKADKGDLAAILAVARHYEARDYSIGRDERVVATASGLESLRAALRLEETDREYRATAIAESLKWRRKAAESGHADSAYILGWRYLNGVGVSKDELQAMEYFASASFQGFQMAQFRLGTQLLEVDREQGERTLRAAAYGGHCQSAEKLMGHYIDQRDVRHAYYWALVHRHLDAQPIERTDWWYEDISLRHVGKRGRPVILEMPQLGVRLGTRQPLGNLSGADMPLLPPNHHYCNDSSDGVVQLLETKLRTTDRIEVQRLASKRIAAIAALKAAPADATASAPPAAKTPLEGLARLGFNPLTLAGCEGTSKGKSALSATQLFAARSPMVVRVYGGGARSALQDHELLGSGVAVSPMQIITNCHVVNAAGALSIKANGSIGAKVTDARLDDDTCTLETDSPLSAYVDAIRPASELEIGEAVYAIGSPQGLENSLTDGLVSGVRSEGDQQFIQTTAPISMGSSGGALFDAFGNLVGITTFYLRDSQGLNFAVPASKWCMSQTASLGGGNAR